MGIFDLRSKRFVLESFGGVKKAGTVVVVAAGNGGMQTADGSPCFLEKDACARKPIDVKNVMPAGCPAVISVAASDMHGELAPYSNYGAVSIIRPRREIFIEGSVVKTDASGKKDNDIWKHCWI